MERRREPKMNERLKLESVDRAASVRFWVDTLDADQATA